LVDNIRADRRSMTDGRLTIFTDADEFRA